MKNGLVINRLVVTGPNLPAAEIFLKPGLNVITGPSNTGKSFIFSCFDYMLGAKDPPKEITESAGYNNIFVEFEDQYKKRFTLRRSLKGGGFSYYDTAFENVTDRSHVTVLSATNKGNSVSSLLSSCSGFPTNIKIKKSVRDETTDFSFRHVSHLFCVSETRIMADDSPILANVGFDTTQYKSAFDYMLTGMDDSSLVARPKAEVVEAKTHAKEEVLSAFLSEADEEVARLEDAKSKFSGMQSGDDAISQLTDNIHNMTARLNEVINQKRNLFGELEKINSRLAEIDGMAFRFSLLQEHYDSDLERLKFISEGENLVSQLQIANCPTCGLVLTENSHLHPSNVEYDGSVQESCVRESEKIRLRQIELRETIISLEVEKQSLSLKQLEAEKRIATFENVAETKLQHDLESERKTLRLMLDRAETEGAYANAVSRAVYLRISKERFIRPSAPVIEVDSAVDTSGEALTRTKGLQQLSDCMKSVLAEWKFSPHASVFFDTTAYDFVIDGVPRRNNGKGVRALLHSAFCVSLLSFCRQTIRPHLGIVILDSPLTTFKEREISEGNSGQEVSLDIQHSFFESLSRSNDQLIIMDNKIPPPIVDNRCNTIRFSKDLSFGRYGFFAVKKKT